MSFFDELLRDSKASMMSYKDARQILDQITGGSQARARALADSLGVPDCGTEDCPIHGSSEVEGLLTDDDLRDMNSDGAWEMVISSTAGAHNNLIRGNEVKAALAQKQADLWQVVAKRLESEEIRVKM